jgi:hypothetical protein
MGVEIEPKESIKQYYESVKDKYPELTEVHFNMICRSPFVLLKRCIKSVLLPKVRFKGLGVFYVDVILANYSLDKLHKRREQNKITQEDFDRIHPILLDYIDRNKDTEEYQKYIRLSKKNPRSVVHKYINVFIDDPKYNNLKPKYKPYVSKEDKPEERNSMDAGIL